MRRTIPLLAAMILTGCQSYNERFTYMDPKTGATNHVVHVSYRSLFMVGESAKLRTETQTMEFIRTVNADGLKSRVDAEGIAAAGTAAGNVIGAAGKAAAGIP
jgi:hypothetical protein